MLPRSYESFVCRSEILEEGIIPMIPMLVALLSLESWSVLPYTFPKRPFRLASSGLGFVLTSVTSCCKGSDESSEQ